MSDERFMEICHIDERGNAYVEGRKDPVGVVTDHATSATPVINVGWPTLPAHHAHQTITSATSGVTHVVGWRNRHGVFITGCGNALVGGDPDTERERAVTCKTCAGLVRAGAQEAGRGGDKS